MNKTGLFSSLERNNSSKPKYRDNGSSCSSPRKVDALVARDMNELSLVEREEILNDVHGVSEIKEESPSQIEQKLKELDAEIGLITSKDAYLRALGMSEAYVKDSNFRLKFLRADSFNVKNAANRMVRFFEQKMQIFGNTLLGKDITLADLDPDDLGVLRNGHLELLSERDRSGRQIFCHIRSREPSIDLRNSLRAFYYMLMSVAEDEDAQKKGLVGVVYNFTFFNESFDAEAIARSIKLRNALPVRFVAIHYCYNQPGFVEYFNCERYAFDRHTRLRCRAHQVSATNFHSALSSFGIPRTSAPNSLVAGLKSENHKEWMQMRKKKELDPSLGDLEDAPILDVSLSNQSVAGVPPIPTLQPQPVSENGDSKSTPLKETKVPAHSRLNQQEALPIVIENVEASSQPTKCTVTPTGLDVLFGRGKVKDHPGNQKLHMIIEKRLSRYEVAEKWEKTVTAEEVVAIIREAGGRFLRSTANGKGWVVADTEVAREKVSHTFRSRLRFKKSEKDKKMKRIKKLVDDRRPRMSFQNFWNKF